MMFFELRLPLNLLHMKFEVIWSDVRMVVCKSDRFDARRNASYLSPRSQDSVRQPPLDAMAHDEYTKQGEPEEEVAAF